MKTLILCIAALSITGCANIYTYELESIVDGCGGHKKVYAMWIDRNSVQAYCTNGDLVKTSRCRMGEVCTQSRNRR